MWAGTEDDREFRGKAEVDSDEKDSPSTTRQMASSSCKAVVDLADNILPSLPGKPLITVIILLI